jgi:hypothetical protein
MQAIKRTLGLVSALALLSGVGTLGCGVEYEEEDDVPAPEFAPESGQIAIPGGLEYAPGPYGFVKGRVIPNFTFIGYPNFMAGSGLTYVSLAEFYNPSGEEVFPEGSPYGAGTPKPRALLMIMSAAWCGPCKQEAAGPLKSHYPLYRPYGHFLGLLVEAVDGSPANYGTATAWADQFDIDYTLTIDPTRQALSIYEPAFPGNMIVRTSDMKIIHLMAGAPAPGSPAETQFWNLFESVMNGTYVDTF